MFWHLLLSHRVSRLDGKNILFHNQLVGHPKPNKSGFLMVRVGLLPQGLARVD
jgi:hypothetical protein